MRQEQLEKEKIALSKLRELAIKKQAFLKSEFGQIAAAAISELQGNHLTMAQDEKLEPWRKAYHTERAAGIAEVINFFVNDVQWLEAGYFAEKEGKQKNE